MIHRLRVRVVILRICYIVPTHSTLLSYNYAPPTATHTLLTPNHLHFSLSPLRPGCHATLMHIATRNLETLNEIIALVQPAEAAVGDKRGHSELHV